MGTARRRRERRGGAPRACASRAAAGSRADGEPTRSPRVGSGTRRAESAAAPTADGSGSSSSSDDEDTKTAKLAKMSAEAKQKGNAAFSGGDYPKAVKQFTMAIRMDKQNHVLFSNRSASYAALGKYEERWQTRSGACDWRRSGVRGTGGRARR